MGKPSPARSPLLSSYGSRLYRDGTSPHRLPRRPSRPAHRAFGPSQSFRGRHARIPGAPPKRRARRFFGRAGAFRCPGILEICSHAGGKPCAAAADQGTTEAAHTSSPSRARRSARTCRERCGGGERAVDRCARSRNPASAIWCGSACCRGIVVDGADVARRRDP